MHSLQTFSTFSKENILLFSFFIFYFLFFHEFFSDHTWFMKNIKAMFISEKYKRKCEEKKIKKNNGKKINIALVFFMNQI